MKGQEGRAKSWTEKLRTLGPFQSSNGWLNSFIVPLPLVLWGQRAIFFSAAFQCYCPCRPITGPWHAGKRWRLGGLPTLLLHLGQLPWYQKDGHLRWTNGWHRKGLQKTSQLKPYLKPSAAPHFTYNNDWGSRPGLQPLPPVALVHWPYLARLPTPATIAFCPHFQYSKLSLISGSFWKTWHPPPYLQAT